MTEQLAWYAAYGSNMAAARFRCYLQGGTPEGASRRYPGARDRRPPAGDRVVRLPGRVYFATVSQVWGGGRALLDPDLPGETPARAWLITAQQFADVVAQEMGREPGDIAVDVTAIPVPGRLQLGSGHYETMVCTGELDGWPVITFTAPWHAADAEPTMPSGPYLKIIGQGLRETCAWDAATAAAHLAPLSGIAGTWDFAQIAELLGGDGGADGALDLRAGSSLATAASGRRYTIICQRPSEAEPHVIDCADRWQLADALRVNDIPVMPGGLESGDYSSPMAGTWRWGPADVMRSSAGCAGG